MARHLKAISAGSHVLTLLGTFGCKQYATALAQAGSASVAELALITWK